MLVDTQPFVFIGYRTHYPDQSRCCVYERMADADFTHGELSTSPLHRLVLIRPEAANKLKYHLSNFNSRFASLLELPFPVANHIPHWPLRQQAIFTMPKDQSSPTISTAPGVNVEASARNTKKPCNCRLGCRYFLFSSAESSLIVARNFYRYPAIITSQFFYVSWL